MIKLGFVRSGAWYKPNRGEKGKFFREFKDANECARWMARSWPQVYCIDYGNQTKAEFLSIWKKTMGLRCKEAKKEKT